MCPNCDALLVRRDNERQEAFNARVYCRRRCHREALRSGKQKLRQIRMTGEPGDW